MVNMEKTKLLVVGHARHGKDTVAELLRDRHGLSFLSSSFFAAEAVCRPYLAVRGIVYPTLDECYADRVNHRAEWHDAITEFNRDDPARLTKAILKVANVYVGMRSDREYHVARDLFDAVLWVDASGRGLPPEPTSSMNITYDPGTMITVDNNHDLASLEQEVDRVVASLFQKERA
jgi:hypothetical protein